jgi:hypothetical protein
MHAFSLNATSEKLHRLHVSQKSIRGLLGYLKGRFVSSFVDTYDISELFPLPVILSFIVIRHVGKTAGAANIAHI